MESKNLVVCELKGCDDSHPEILSSYPELRAGDLVSAWAYYRGHREEIEIQIKENDEL